MQNSLTPTTKTRRNLLVEVAWEVCNQLGGIYTVIRSKAPTMVEKWGDDYCLIGTYLHKNVSAEFEPTDDLSGVYGQAVQRMREAGFEVHYGTWLVTGRPRAVLFNPFSVYHRLGALKYELWEHHDIASPEGDDLFSQVVAFGYLTKVFLQTLEHSPLAADCHILAHFHEWMAAMPIPELRRQNTRMGLLFTTHATLLGRYVAMNDPFFYDRLPHLNWYEEAQRFNVIAVAKTERAAAHGAHVFTTVSEVTAQECIHFLGRKPDVILPNGLNIERFTALHEFQVLHQRYKEQINQFVMGHFFQSYSFDLDNTLYFFTSGRFEYRNKGYDLTLEALARLNWKMKHAGIDTTVVMFFITKQPFRSINPQALHSRAVMEEIRQDCEAIVKQVGTKLFHTAAASQETKLPDLNEFVDDYWKLRLRRTIQSWKSQHLPSVITHDLVDSDRDEILQFLHKSNMVNHYDDRVKIVYHPDFIAPTNPLFAMEYGQFVRGCHLGVFPSYYEPWGYTPLECIASGVPTITSDLAGFGDYVENAMPDHNDKGIYMIHRRDRGFYEAAEQMAEIMFEFVQLSRRDRIELRNRVERSSSDFDWQNLVTYYNKAYDVALERIGARN